MTPLFNDALKVLDQRSPVYLVGGIIRDQLLGIPANDFDAVIALSLDEVESKLKASGFVTHRIGANKQTVSLFKDGARLDIAEIESLEQDALRRDFTINALYQRFNTETVIDPLDGQSDLRAKRLRACGSPKERFQEDPVRILRMIRFAVKYDLQVEDQTWLQGKTLVHLLENAAKERITQELGRILTQDDVEKGIRLLEEIGYFERFIPELARLKGLVQNRYHSKDAWEHTIHVTRNTPPRLVLRLAGLFHDLGKWEVASKECLVYGKLRRTPDGVRVAGYQIIGKQLNKWNHQYVKIRGARLDHYPEVIQVKSIRRGTRDQEGFEWIVDGKRHFLGHEKESARLLKQILPRFRWSMVLSAEGVGERELIQLVENHMGGTLAFMNELRGEQSGNLEQKAKRFAYALGWDGRTFKTERIINLMELWQADFYGGKQRDPGDYQRFEAIKTLIIDTAHILDDRHQSLVWEVFAKFIAEKKLRGEAIGKFKDIVRYKAMVEGRDPEDIHFLAEEYQRFTTDQSSHRQRSRRI